MYLRTNSHVHHFRMYQFLSQMIVLVTAWIETKELAVIVNLFKPTTIPWTQSNEQFTT